MTEELKTCPFCGGKAEIQTNQDGNIFQVVCSSCGARNLWSSIAAEEWNVRTHKNTDLKLCPICGKKMSVFDFYEGKVRVMCMRCGLTTGDFETQDEAKAAWNRRPDNNG